MFRGVICWILTIGMFLPACSGKGRHTFAGAQADAAAILREYAAGIDELGSLAVESRFRHYRTATVVPLLPDRLYCTGYYALDDGLYCYRAHYAEPFTTQRVRDPDMPAATAARALIEAADLTYADAVRIQGLLLEYVDGPAGTCVTYVVSRRERTPPPTDLQSLFAASWPLRLEGLVCRIRGRTVSVFERPEHEAASFRLWDIVETGGGARLVVLRSGDEWQWLELYAADGADLRLLASLTVDDLYEAAGQIVPR